MSAFDTIKHIPWNDKNGNIEAIQPFEKIVIDTCLGEVVPIYSVEDHGRKKLTPVRYYNEGGIRSISLQDPTIIKTPIGEVSVELITFYKDGSLCRAFPLNGKLSGFWTEENERKLTKTYAIPTPVGEIRVKPLYIHFYETGELKSVTFWPGERVTLQTPLGPILIKKGLSFHKCGALASCEPEKPINLITPIGVVEAFDPSPNGMSGEKNSIAFSEDGKLTEISTSGSSIKIYEKGEGKAVYEPAVVRSMCSDSESAIEALRIEFMEEEVIFKNGVGREVIVPFPGSFIVEPFTPLQPLAGLACCTL